jgi:hypothetical protein
MKQITLKQVLFSAVIFALLVALALTALFSKIPLTLRFGVAIGALSGALFLVVVILRRDPDAAARRALALGLLLVGSAGFWSTLGGRTFDFKIFQYQATLKVGAENSETWAFLAILASSMTCFFISSNLLLKTGTTKRTASQDIFDHDWTSAVQKVVSNNFEKNHYHLHTRLSDELGADTKELARLYVEPDVQATNPADYNEDNPVAAVRFPVSDYLQRFLSRKFVEKDGTNVLFVLSDAGMGKSSLFAMLALSQIGVKNWPRDVKVEFFKIGLDTHERVSTVSDKQNTILLLDSLDEDQSTGHSINERISDLLNATLPFRQVLISVRTQYLPKGEEAFGEGPGFVRVGGYRCSLIYLAPFSDKQVQMYLENFYKGSFFDRLLEPVTGKQSAKVATAQEVCNQISSLQMRPMLLQHIDRLSNEHNISRSFSEFALYKDLVYTWLEREERKEGGPKFEDLRNACIKLALMLQRTGARKISSDELTSVLGQSSGVERNLSLIDIESRSLVNKTSDGEWRFSHYSIQEFLSVLWFVELGWETKQKIQVDPGQHRKLLATDLMLTFLSNFSSDFWDDASGLSYFDFSRTALSSMQHTLEEPFSSISQLADGTIIIRSMDLEFSILRSTGDANLDPLNRCLVPIAWRKIGKHPQPYIFLSCAENVGLTGVERTFSQSTNKLEILSKALVVSLFLRREASSVSSYRTLFLEGRFDRRESDALDGYLNTLFPAKHIDEVYLLSVEILKKIGIHSYSKQAEERLGVGVSISEARRKFSLLANTVISSKEDCHWSYSFGVDLRHENFTTNL